MNADSYLANMEGYKFKYRDFAEALYEALISDPFYSFLQQKVEGDVLNKKEAMIKYFDYSLIEGEKYGQLHLPKAHNHGVSIWSTPVDSSIELERKNKRKEFLLNCFGRSTIEAYLSIIQFMTKNSLELIPTKSWYLSIVGLKSSFQNQGLGAGLINPILDKCDVLNIPTYLETFTPRNMNFYRKLGYKVVDSFYEPTIKSEYWLMMRSARYDL